MVGNTITIYEDGFLEELTVGKQVENELVIDVVMTSEINLAEELEKCWEHQKSLLLHCLEMCRVTEIKLFEERKTIGDELEVMSGIDKAYVGTSESGN